MGNVKTWFSETLAEFKQDFEFRLDAKILDFTEQICEVMERKGISRSELAESLGKNKSYVSRVLNGHVNLTLKTMLQFAEAVSEELDLRVGKAAEVDEQVFESMSDEQQDQGVMISVMAIPGNLASSGGRSVFCQMPETGGELLGQA